jgi:hypothetical protein
LTDAGEPIHPERAGALRLFFQLVLNMISVQDVVRLYLSEQREQTQGSLDVMPSALQLSDEFHLPPNTSLTFGNVALRLSQMAQLHCTVHCDRLSGSPRRMTSPSSLTA